MVLLVNESSWHSTLVISVFKTVLTLRSDSLLLGEWRWIFQSKPVYQCDELCSQSPVTEQHLWLAIVFSHLNKDDGSFFKNKWQFILHTLHLSTRSLSEMMSTERGSCPAGAFSGISCKQKEELNATAENELAKKPFGQTKETNILPEL